MYQAALAMDANAHTNASDETFPFCNAISASILAEGESQLSIASGDEVTLYDRCPLRLRHPHVLS